MNKIYIPEGYSPKLNRYDTQRAIDIIKQLFQQNFCKALSLKRVSAPLFVSCSSGLNDNLNGTERPVTFDVPAIDGDAEIVHSLAKWKRLALKRYDFWMHEGLLTDMNAIRRHETLDALHSIYVDQWDWEKVINPEERNLHTLKNAVKDIYEALRETQFKLCGRFPGFRPFLPEEITFVSTQELEDMFPGKTPKEREDAVCEKFGAVFLMQIGLPLKSGKPHDGRAPDYDDWMLNGDILVWNPVLERAFEISSMGIRVDAKALDAQLQISGCTERANLPFHKALLNNELPQTMGGGLGQSRICMLLLGKRHIGEVQSSIWSEEMLSECEAEGIHIL